MIILVCKASVFTLVGKLGTGPFKPLTTLAFTKIYFVRRSLRGYETAVRWCQMLVSFTRQRTSGPRTLSSPKISQVLGL